MSEIDGIKLRLKRIEDAVGEIDVEDLENDVAMAKNDTDDLRNDVDSLRSDLDDLSERVATLEILMKRR